MKYKLSVGLKRIPPDTVNHDSMSDHPSEKAASVSRMFDAGELQRTFGLRIRTSRCKAVSAIFQNKCDL